MANTTAFPWRAKYMFMTGGHVSGNTYKIALFTDTATYASNITQYTSTNEVANGNGYTTGGQTLCTYTSTIDTGQCYIDWSSDPTWPASTISAHACVIYNDTDTNKSLVGVWDFGSTINSSNGAFTVTFPAAAADTALVRLT